MYRRMAIIDFICMSAIYAFIGSIITSAIREFEYIPLPEYGKYLLIAFYGIISVISLLINIGISHKAEEIPLSIKQSQEVRMWYYNIHINRPNFVILFVISLLLSLKPSQFGSYSVLFTMNTLISVYILLNAIKLRKISNQYFQHIRLPNK